MPTESEPTPTPKEETSVRCQVCGASLADSSELATHMEGHAEREAEGLPATPAGATHRCAFCPAAFDTPEQLKEHLGTAHQK